MASQQKREDSARTAPSRVQIRKFLDSLDYPVEQQALLERGRGEGTDENMMEAFQRVPDRDYDSHTAVSREVGRID